MYTKESTEKLLKMLKDSGDYFDSVEDLKEWLRVYSNLRRDWN